MAVVTLYQMEASPFCDKIRRILAIKGVETRIAEVKFMELTGRYKRLNPTGKVPALEHDDQLISDSTDIAHYLERVFPDPPLIPADPAEAALVHALEDWADESLYFMEMTLRFTLPHNAGRLIPLLTKYESPVMRKLLTAMIPRALKSTTRTQGIGKKSADQIMLDLTRHVEALEGLLGGADWLVGDRLTLADIAVFVQMACIAMTDEGQSVLKDYPTVSRWLAAVEQSTRSAPSSPQPYAAAAQ